MKPKDQKRAEAAERLTFWQEKSTSEQILCLNARLGFKKGAKKQRARLEKKL